MNKEEKKVMRQKCTVHGWVVYPSYSNKGAWHINVKEIYKDPYAKFPNMAWDTNFNSFFNVPVVPMMISSKGYVYVDEEEKIPEAKAMVMNYYSNLVDKALAKYLDASEKYQNLLKNLLKSGDKQDAVPL